MSSSALEAQAAMAHRVDVSEDALTVALTDGRTLSVPLAWYPRLWHGTVQERGRWRLIGGGQGIHWPDLDEDIRVDGLLGGRRSGESQASLKRWLEGRGTAGDGSEPSTP
jgi:hypothetical protein